MFIEQEKQLVEKNYVENIDSPNMLSFFYHADKTCQINVTKEESNLYKVSFPMSNRSIHYATYFSSKSKAKDYLDFIIKSHL